MHRDPHITAFGGLVLMALILAACGTQLETPSAVEMSLATPGMANARESQAVASTPGMTIADEHAAATAEIARANAQATLNSANATLSAAQTQDAIRQTQMAGRATTDAEIILDQQHKDELAAGTQTAVADSIATQTRAAAATSQWYADQARQQEEQRGGPITFLWMWCPPIFIVLFASLVLWGFWRWLKIQQANQRIPDHPVDRLQAPAVDVIDHQQEDSLPYPGGDVIDSRYQLTKPDDQVRRWLDEVKRKLLSSDRKDEDDDAHN